MLVKYSKGNRNFLFRHAHLCGNSNSKVLKLPKSNVLNSESKLLDKVQ